MGNLGKHTSGYASVFKSTQVESRGRNRSHFFSRCSPGIPGVGQATATGGLRSYKRKFIGVSPAPDPDLSEFQRQETFLHSVNLELLTTL